MISRFSLQIIGGPVQKDTFSFDQDMVTLGRSGIGNQVIINEPAVSQRHAIIRRSEEGFFFEDIQSSNGSLINDSPVSGKGTHPLCDGDKLVLGQTTFLFQLGAKNGKGGGRKKGQGGLIHHLKTVPKQRLVIYLLLCVIGATLGYSLVPHRTSSVSALPHHVNRGTGKEPVPLPSEEMYRLAAASGQQQLSFSFMGKSPLTRLRFLAEGIDANEVLLRLNGKDMGYLPETFASQEEIVFPLFDGQILQQQKNIIIFHSTSSNGWQIGKLHLSMLQQTACNPEEAQKDYDLGKELYDEKSVVPQNLYYAEKKLELALSSGSSCQPSPDWYEEGKAFYEQVSQELLEKCQTKQFYSKKLSQMGKHQEAIDTLEEVYSLVPDMKDPRTEKIEHLIADEKKLLPKNKKH